MSELSPLVMWVYGDEGQFEGALGNVEEVNGVSVMEAFDDRSLYRVQYVPADSCPGRCIADVGGIVTGIEGDAEVWSFESLFPDRESASKFHRDCREQRLDIDVTSVHNLEPGDQLRFGLTADQRELLVTALDRGYFEVPRRSTLNELADEFDVSDQSVSARLRRATATLVENALS